MKTVLERTLDAIACWCKDVTRYPIHMQCSESPLVEELLRKLFSYERAGLAQRVHSNEHASLAYGVLRALSTGDAATASFVRLIVTQCNHQHGPSPSFVLVVEQSLFVAALSAIYALAIAMPTMPQPFLFLRTAMRCYEQTTNVNDEYATATARFQQDARWIMRAFNEKLVVCLPKFEDIAAANDDDADDCTLSVAVVDDSDDGKLSVVGNKRRRARRRDEPPPVLAGSPLLLEHASLLLARAVLAASALPVLMSIHADIGRHAADDLSLDVLRCESIEALITRGIGAYSPPSFSRTEQSIYSRRVEQIFFEACVYTACRSLAKLRQRDGSVVDDAFVVDERVLAVLTRQLGDSDQVGAGRCPVRVFSVY